MVNQHYQTVATLQGADGWVLTLHSMVISGDDAWVTANKNLPMNLSQVRRRPPTARSIDSAVQEYNLKTGKLVRTWDALDHIPVHGLPRDPADQRVPVGRLPRQLDQPAPHGTLLVSMRNTWAAYQIDTATGQIIWTLGGKHSSFRLASGAPLRVAARRDDPGHQGHLVRRPLLPDHRGRHLPGSAAGRRGR